jgi:ribosomal protein L21
MNVELMTVKEVADILKTAPMKIKSGILNGTMPIGTVINEGKNDRVIIIKTRFEKWIRGEL